MPTLFDKIVLTLGVLLAAAVASPVILAALVLSEAAFR